MEVIYSAESRHNVCLACHTVQPATSLMLAPNQLPPGRARNAGYTAAPLSRRSAPARCGQTRHTVQGVVEACLRRCCRDGVGAALRTECAAALVEGVSRLMGSEGPRTASERGSNIVNALVSYGFREFEDAAGVRWPRVTLLNTVIDQSKLVSAPVKTLRVVQAELFKVSRTNKGLHPVLKLLGISSERASRHLTLLARALPITREPTARKTETRTPEEEKSGREGGADGAG